MTDLELINQVGYKKIFNTLYRSYFKSLPKSSVIKADHSLRLAFDKLIKEGAPTSLADPSSFSTPIERATVIFLELTGVDPHAFK